MKLSEFEQHYQHLSKLVEGMLITKRAEYATEEDRISNFKQMCSLTHHSPAENAANYWLKHISSTYDICVNASQGILPTQERLEEKITDSIAYLYLIYACLQEQMAQPSIQKCSNCPLNGSVSDDSTKDDSETVSTKNDENFSKNEDSLNFYNTYHKQFEERQEELLKYHPELLKYCLENSPMLDTSDSITKTPRPNVLEDLNLRTNL